MCPTVSDECHLAATDRGPHRKERRTISPSGIAGFNPDDLKSSGFSFAHAISPEIGLSLDHFLHTAARTRVHLKAFPSNGSRILRLSELTASANVNREHELPPQRRDL